MRTLLPLLSALLLPAALSAPAALAQDDVTIYRCTDAQGRLALQDVPCAEGQTQEVRNMVRPQDPPPAAQAPTPATGATDALPAEPQIVSRSPPRPMFECVTPDGERYTSDSGEGNPRPAPVWNYGGFHAGPGPGAPPGPRSSAERRAAGIASPGMSTSPGPSLTRPAQSQPAPPPPSRPGRPGRHHGYPGFGYGHAGGMIRDECHPLPQAQVCTLLGERRTEIRRRVFNAQPTERATLRAEERDITARLNDDCGIR